MIQANSYIGQPIFSPGTVIGDAVFGGSVTAATTTTFTAQSGQGDMRVVVKGTFTVSGGVVTGGTVESFTAFAGDTKVADAKGYALNALTLYTAIQTDDYSEIEELLFNVASKVTGSKQDDISYGSDFNDKLLGKDGNDELYGWSGDDEATIEVYEIAKHYELRAADQLAPAAFYNWGNSIGDPTTSTGFAMFGPSPHSVWDGQDLIDMVDYAEVLPAGYLSKSYFHVGKEAKSVDQVVIYDKKSGNIYYDGDGSEAGDQLLIAKVKAGTKLHADDFFISSGLTLL